MTEQIEAAPLSAAGTRPAPARVQVPLDPVDLRAERDRVRRARAAHAARLSRLRFYSYCLTLTACVLALMSFMYLTQGTADGDATFVWLGAGFVAATVTALWSALRITQVSEFPAA
jgi:hypothetical protein